MAAEEFVGRDLAGRCSHVVSRAGGHAAARVVVLHALGRATASRAASSPLEDMRKEV